MVPFPVYQYVHNSVCKKKNLLSLKQTVRLAWVVAMINQEAKYQNKKRSFDSCCGRACFVADYCSMMGKKKSISNMLHIPQ